MQCQASYVMKASCFGFSNSLVEVKAYIVLVPVSLLPVVNYMFSAEGAPAVS